MAPKKKPEGQKKMTKIEIRVMSKTKNRIKGLAKIYAGGNVSAWLEYAALNAPRKFLR